MNELHLSLCTSLCGNSKAAIEDPFDSRQVSAEFYFQRFERAAKYFRTVSSTLVTGCEETRASFVPKLPYAASPMHMATIYRF